MNYTFKKVPMDDPKLMDRLEELGAMGYAIAAYVPSSSRDIPAYFMMQRAYGTPEVTIVGDDVRVEVTNIPTIDVRAPMGSGGGLIARAKMSDLF